MKPTKYFHKLSYTQTGGVVIKGIHQVLELINWVYFGRHYLAPTSPFSLIKINPHDIAYVDKKINLPFYFSSAVLGGEWDRGYEVMDGPTTFEKSLHMVVSQGYQWKKTPSFQNLMNSEYYEGYSESEIITKLENYEDLYYFIRDYGYKTQRELKHDQVKTISIHQSIIPELNEVTVDIARDGQFIWFGGNHRLAIARLLGIEAIPVRVRVRHRNWQYWRDKVYRGDAINDEDHPDLMYHK